LVYKANIKIEACSVLKLYLCNNFNTEHASIF